MTRRLVQFAAGVVLCGISSAMLVRSTLGLGPWDVLHEGMAERTGLSFGTVLVLTGIAVLLLWIPLRQRLRWGTLANQIGVGLSADLGLGMFGETQTIAACAGLMVAGIVLQGIGTAMYIGAHFGTGPRDGLMTGIVGRTGWTVRSVRTAIEVIVLAAGWLLGGTVGVGTLLYAVAIGPVIHASLPWFDTNAREDRQLAGQAAG